MGPETPGAVDDLIAGPPRASEPAPARIENRIAAVVLALVPGGLVVYFGFNGGGFFPRTGGFACVIVIQLLIVRVLLAHHPFEGFGWRGAGAGGPPARLVPWGLLSRAWAPPHHPNP